MSGPETQGAREPTEPLEPLETLYEPEGGEPLPLPPRIAALYGTLAFPAHPGRPHVYGNFVTTLDGVVSLNAPNHSGGGDISGFNKHDRMVMGILRAVADAVIVGAGTLEDVPQHLWTAGYIYPDLAAEYAALRAALGKTEPPLNVILTGSGAVDLSLPVFQSGTVPALIVTTEPGRRRLSEHGPLPHTVTAVAVTAGDRLSARDILKTVSEMRSCERILVEGGPHVMGDFFGERVLDELFLTLAPQVAGREKGSPRPSLVEGRLFAPADPLWGELVGVKRAGSHLFLRYAFATVSHP
jgi:riboflavin biosynthesis pyrimidine reductase